MSQTADVDGMRLTMPAGWWVWKYDDSDFHQISSRTLRVASRPWMPSRSTLLHKPCG